MTTEQIEDETEILATYTYGKPELDRYGRAIYWAGQEWKLYDFHTDWNQLHNVWQKFRDENIERQKLDLATFKDNIKLMIVYYDTPAAAASELAKAITRLQTIKK